MIEFAGMPYERQDRAGGGEIKPWDSDHTALVHVLWAAERDGLTVKDADHLAERIMCSKWMRAVRLHARERPTT